MIRPFIIQEIKGKNRFHLVTVLEHDLKNKRYLCARDTKFFYIPEKDLVEKFKYIITAKGK